jgi:hypothetical protein
MTVADLGGTTPMPLYFGVTNTFAMHPGSPVSAGVQLSVGATVQLEVASADSSALRFELHRVRRDGTTELLAPIDAPSGFSLSTFEATSDGTYLLWFPFPSTQTVVISLGCETAGAHCAAAQQPGESCAPGFACDTGLDCALQRGQCDPWVALGTCAFRPPVATCQDGTTPDLRVCGCDGRTYASECVARASGAGIASVGACASPTDVVH